MSLKEQLAEMKGKLAELKERIEANDEEAINEGIQLKSDIEAKAKEVEQAEKKAALLNSIGTKNTQEGEKEMENTIKNMDMSNLKSAPGAVSTYIKANTDVETSTQQSTYSPVVALPGDRARVRDLFGKEEISTNALTYYVLGDLEGTIAGVEEGAAKPQIHIGYTPETQPLAKVAAYFKETDELVNDNAFLESAIRNRGVYEFEKAVEDYLIDNLLDFDGVQSGATAISFDNILAAKMDIVADTGYTPDALVINPADLATLMQAKDGNLQYLLGGPAYGAYGNGAYGTNPRIWGLEVIESAAMPAGKCLVGAFKAGASVVTKAGEGLRVEVSNSNENDFIYNRVTVRMEERMLLAVRVPAAFEVVGQ